MEFLQLRARLDACGGEARPEHRASLIPLGALELAGHEGQQRGLPSGIRPLAQRANRGQRRSRRPGGIARRIRPRPQRAGEDRGDRGARGQRTREIQLSGRVALPVGGAQVAWIGGRRGAEEQRHAFRLVRVRARHGPELPACRFPRYRSGIQRGGDARSLRPAGEGERVGLGHVPQPGGRFRRVGDDRRGRQRLSAQSGAAPPTTRPESTDAPTSTHPEGPRTADRSAPGRSTSTAVSSPESRSNPGTWARPGTAAEPQAARATPARRRARRIPPSCTRSAAARAPSRDRMWGMRLSIATKVFLGFAAVLVMSGAVSLFGIVQMHRIGQGLSLVSSGYFPLTRIAGSLEAFQKERERSTDRLLAEADPAQRASLIALDRTYFARIADERLARAREQIQAAREGASARDRAALDRIDARLQLLSARIAEQDQ